MPHPDLLSSSPVTLFPTAPSQAPKIRASQAEPSPLLSLYLSSPISSLPHSHQLLPSYDWSCSWVWDDYSRTSTDTTVFTVPSTGVTQMARKGPAPKGLADRWAINMWTQLLAVEQRGVRFCGHVRKSGEGMSGSALRSPGKCYGNPGSHRLILTRGTGVGQVWVVVVQKGEEVDWDMCGQTERGTQASFPTEGLYPYVWGTNIPKTDFGRRNTAAQGRKGHLVGEAGQMGGDQEGSQVPQRLCFILPMVGSW